MKGKMDGDAMKNLVINHIEKLVLVLVVLVFGLLVLRGTSIEPFDEARNPENLKSKAMTVLTSLEDNHWDTIKEEPERLFPPKYEKTAGDSRAAIDAGPHFYPIGPPKNRTHVKRRDPKITDPQYAPQAIRVSGHLAAITLKPMPNVKSPYDALEDAGKMEVEVEKRKTPSKTRSRRQPRGYGSESSSMEMSEMDMEMAGGYGESGSGSESGGMSGYGMSGYGISQGRTLDPKYDHGASSAGLGSMYGEMGSSGTMSSGSAEMSGGSGEIGGTSSATGSKPFPYTFHFIAGTAIMPNEALSDEFDAALADASGHLVTRDRPKYLSFRVIRADVTGRDVKDLEEPDEQKIASEKGDWVVTTSTSYMHNSYTRFWGGNPAEIIPRKFTDPALTAQLPPMLLQDNRSFLTHPIITAWIEEQQELAKKKRTVVEPEVTNDAPSSGTQLDLESLRSRNKTQTGSSGYGEGMDSSSAMGSEMQYGSGYDTSYGEESSMMGSSGEMGYGGEMGYSGGMGYGGGSTVVVASEYKLIRFYDFRDSPKKNPNTPWPGRTYVYRIQVAIEDPNYPIDLRFAPALKTLDGDSLARVQQRAADDLVLSKKGGKPYRTGYIWSAWSEPSPPVSLPEMQWVAAGTMEKGAEYDYNGVRFSKTPNVASLVAGDWDWPLATYRSAEFKKVPVGAVLNLPKFDDEVIDPLSKVIKKLENAKVITNDVLVDIQGGDPLAVTDGEDAEPLQQPAKLLLFSPTGGLRVHHEVRDSFNYRMYTFADERERLLKAQSATSPMSSESMDSSMMEEGSGYFSN